MKKVLLFLLFITYYLLPATTHAQSVDILWQGENYTPPFYQGRNLWSNESEITFTAITQGLSNPQSLVYTWIRNGTVLGLVSGIGKSSLSFLDTIFSKPVTITVEVLNAQEELLAQNTIVIAPTAVELTMYENHPLYGFMFHQETSGGYQMRAQEATLTAFPLFFSTETRDNPFLTYSWRSNAGEDSSESSVTYRAPEEAIGVSSVSVDVDNTDFLRQKVKRNFLIQFGDEND